VVSLFDGLLYFLLKEEAEQLQGIAGSTCEAEEICEKNEVAVVLAN
jgi:hypothetical protein